VGKLIWIPLSQQEETVCNKQLNANEKIQESQTIIKKRFALAKSEILTTLKSGTLRTDPRIIRIIRISQTKKAIKLTFSMSAKPTAE
jgi:hypothetical protein